MGVVIETCVKYPGGRTWNKGTDVSPPHSSSDPGVFYTYFYNHAHRILEISRIFNGFFEPLLDPGGGFISETAVT